MRIHLSNIPLCRLALSIACLLCFYCQPSASAQCGSVGSGYPGCGPYRPTAYDDLGTDDPYPYDGYDATTNAFGVLAQSPDGGTVVNSAMDYEYEGGGFYQVYPLTGDITYSNFGSVTAAADLTLYIPYSLSTTGGDEGEDASPNIIVTVTIAGTAHTVYNNAPGPSASGTLTYTIPSGTYLADVQVTIEMQPDGEYDNFDPQLAAYNALAVDVYIN